MTRYAMMRNNVYTYVQHFILNFEHVTHLQAFAVHDEMARSTFKVTDDQQRILPWLTKCFLEPKTGGKTIFVSKSVKENMRGYEPPKSCALSEGMMWFLKNTQS